MATPLPPFARDAAPNGPEGVAHAFPAMRTRDGDALADGEFTQWIEEGRVHVRIRYDFGADRRIEERVLLREQPTLRQEAWSWEEHRDGRLHRRFQVDFLAGVAVAEKVKDGELRRWSKTVELEPGRAFVGSAFAVAIKAHRARLLQGEEVELQTVGFTPQPRAARVEVSYGGLDRVPMSGRVVEGDRFVIHPLIPALLRPFIEVPDSRIWLVHEPPAAFLRWEGPLAEPDDPIVRVDLLPGEPSGPAAPVR